MWYVGAIVVSIYASCLECDRLVGIRVVGIYVSCVDIRIVVIDVLCGCIMVVGWDTDGWYFCIVCWNNAGMLEY